MTDNEKAAIVVGLWKPETYFKASGLKVGPVSCPDMRDPANWTKGLANLSSVIAMRWLFDEQPDMSGKRRCAFYIQHKACGRIRHNGWRLSLDDAVFAALVALYDMEHPA